MNEIMGSVRFKDKVTIASVMAGLALVIVVVVALLSGITVDNHKHVYSYALRAGENGGFDLVGECTNDNCEDPYYTEYNIAGVTLYSAVAPTCSSAGNKVYSYTRGNINVKYTENISPIAHDYSYDIVETDGVKYILGVCRNQGCTRPELQIAGITNLELVDSVPGTCFSPRQDTYSCTLSNGEKISFVTTIDEDIPHTLNGVLANTIASENGNFLYGTEGITLSGKDIGCGEVGSGCYVCEVCKALISVGVYKVEHNYVYNNDDLTPPTFQKDGVAVISCLNDGCTDTVSVIVPMISVGTSYVVLEENATEAHANIYKYRFESLQYGFEYVYSFEAGEKLQHNYTYELRPYDGKIMALVGTCEQPDCQSPVIVDNSVEIDMRNTSTCLYKGYIYFTCDKDGQTYTAVLASPEFAPHSYTYNLNSPSTKVPSFTEAGSVVLTCTTERCEHTVTVELPKVDIGNNATISSDEPLYQILNYTYQTEYGFVITMIIPVYK